MVSLVWVSVVGLVQVAVVGLVWVAVVNLVWVAVVGRVVGRARSVWVAVVGLTENSSFVDKGLMLIVICQLHL